MKKLNKKGFTIVELVIVIAVIAILAGVMIPSFSYVIDQANAVALEAKAAEAYKQAYAIDLADGYFDQALPEGQSIDGLTYEADKAISYTDGKATIYFVDNEWVDSLPEADDEAPEADDEGAEG